MRTCHPVPGISIGHCTHRFHRISCADRHASAHLNLNCFQDGRIPSSSYSFVIHFKIFKFFGLYFPVLCPGLEIKNRQGEIPMELGVPEKVRICASRTIQWSSINLHQPRCCTGHRGSIGDWHRLSGNTCQRILRSILSILSVSFSIFCNTSHWSPPAIGKPWILDTGRLLLILNLLLSQRFTTISKGLRLNFTTRPKAENLQDLKISETVKQTERKW